MWACLVEKRIKAVNIILSKYLWRQSDVDELGVIDTKLLKEFATNETKLATNETKLRLIRLNLRSMRLNLP